MTCAISAQNLSLASQSGFKSLDRAGYTSTIRKNTKTNAAQDLDTFEKFARAVLRVPKAAVGDAESKRQKRVHKPTVPPPDA
jgi:hypothetical protein